MNGQNNQKFRYTVMRFTQPQTVTKNKQQEVINTLEESLNKYAAEGWRLVATAPTREAAERDYIFERSV